MATFVEKYVRRPIAEVDKYASDLLSLKIENMDKSTFVVTLFDKAQSFERSVRRSEDPALSTGGDEDKEEE